jgi:beta-galactosidase
MKMIPLFSLVLALNLAVFTQGRNFSVQGEHFLLDGKPIIIRSGEMHYPRVPVEHWRDRFRKAKAMGLNTITTYVFWDLHEKLPGRFDFSGNLDVARFAKIAQEEGLFLIVRPGPYICTEWDFGGIPSWLLREKGMQVRSKDPRFIAASDRYLKEVGKRLIPHQIQNGGNIIMVQVENEYGSFGNDREYMSAVKLGIDKAGFTVLLFTSDGPGEQLLKGGTLPGVTSVINFGSGDDPARQFESFARFRTGVPRMVGEYWIGWFDHWGERHHTVRPETVARGVDYMLANGISFNLYMFHGGWTFGYMAGANYSSTSPYQPDTSDYDYDGVLDAAGRVTPKYPALRDVIRKHFPTEPFQDVKDDSNIIEIPEFNLDESAGLADAVKILGKVRFSENVKPMEDLGQNHGYVFYRHRFVADANGTLEFKEQRDYSHVFVNQKLVGKLDRRLKERSIKIDAKKGDVLEVLVENMGRINFGKEFIFDRKGITEKVSLDGVELKGWEIVSLPFDDPSRLKFSRKDMATNIFFRGAFALNSVGDTFLDMRRWGKGHAWVNGHHLGRFWNIGPQQSLYVPAGWLIKGKNSIIVLDLENPGNRLISGSSTNHYGNK